MTWEIREGHVLDLLRVMPPESVHCVVTSPPYWGLRAYKTQTQVWGGNTTHEHVWQQAPPRRHRSEQDVVDLSSLQASHRASCPALPETDICACSAWRGELGLEPTPELYVQHLVEVFKEVKRVLRDDGVLFLNMGDCFSSAEYGKIREDEQAHLFQLPLEIQLELFRLWAQNKSSSLQGNVRDLLSAIMETAASAASKRTCTEVLPNPQETVPQSDSSSQQTSSPTNDSSIGRTMRLLRGEKPDFPVSRSHQRTRQTRVSQDRSPSRSLETSNTGRTPKGQISSSLLELQRCAWSVWEVSSLELNLSSVPRQARPLFSVTLKPKDLVGIPWRVAFALQADGWWLRSDLIWSKPNPMPESVTDRPTRSHEYLFLLTKSASYYYDAEAIKEPCKDSSIILRLGQNVDVQIGSTRAHAGGKTNGPMKAVVFGGMKATGYGTRRHSGKPWTPGMAIGASTNTRTGNYLRANKRSVWEIPTHGYNDAHFAVFPEALVEPCIRAGSKEGDTVLDCFAGSGTTGVVALKLGRSFLGLELNPDYVAMAQRRIGAVMPLFA